jgi:hypothetical protein
MSDATHNPDAAQAAQAAIQQQLKRDELMAKFGVQAPIAFMRQLGNAQVHTGQRPSPQTHMLSWKETGSNHKEKKLYDEQVVSVLLDYIFMLEEQLAIEAVQFRQDSISTLIDNHHLDGFTPAQP